MIVQLQNVQIIITSNHPLQKLVNYNKNNIDCYSTIYNTGPDCLPRSSVQYSLVAILYSNFEIASISTRVAKHIPTIVVHTLCSFELIFLSIMRKIWTLPKNVGTFVHQLSRLQTLFSLDMIAHPIFQTVLFVSSTVSCRYIPITYVYMYVLC